MSRIFYLADPHFFHDRILKLMRRPFASLTDMHEALVANINARVDHDDTLWILGDFTNAARDGKAETIFHRLNGHKHLIWGNHDSLDAMTLPWVSSGPYAEISDGGETVVLFHYPIRSWNGLRQGWWHLHGHTHGDLPDLGRSADVGVDCWNFMPVTLDEVRRRRKGPEVDAYGRGKDYVRPDRLKQAPDIRD